MILQMFIYLRSLTKSHWLIRGKKFFDRLREKKLHFRMLVWMLVSFRAN